MLCIYTMKSIIVNFFKTILIVAGFFYCNISVDAAALDAGFKEKLWHTPEKTLYEEPVRIYTTIYNQSSFDIVGTIKLYQGTVFYQEVPLTLAQNTTLHEWFDVTITSGTPTFVAVLSDVKKSELGKLPEPITLLNPTSTVLKITPKKKPTPVIISLVPTTTTSTPTFTTVSSDDTASPPSSFTSTTNNTSSTNQLLETTKKNTVSFLQTISEKIQPSLTNLTSHLTTRLIEQKQKIDKEIKDNKENEPVPLLADSAKHLEQKTPWLKIPRNYIPSFKELQSWSLGAALFVLRTWWLMLIILLLLLRALWKLWCYAKRGDDY